MVKNAISVKETNAKLKNINIDLNIEEGLVMNMDVRMMETIFRNLVSNAIKFSHRDSSITVTGKKEGDYVIISIQDQGIGMSEEIKNELFKYGKIPPRVGTEDESRKWFWPKHL